MQTLIQVFATTTTSLRDRVTNDSKLGDFGLRVTAHKKPGRRHGWAKLHMDGGHGAINIEWLGSSQMLVCRVVTRGGRPDAITGAFIQFLLARLRRQITAIHILPG